MGYTNVALKDKILDIYPEIMEHSINVGLDFNDEKNTFVVKFKKDHHELTTYLERKHADECMDGLKCIHLGIQISEFMKNFEH